jgi:hypothetical protein
MIEHLRTHLAFVWIFSAPVILLAQADSGTASPSLVSYHSDFPSIQNLLQHGCANHNVDSARATFAYNAYEQASGLLTRLRWESQADALFVGDPKSTVEAEFAAMGEQSQAKASEALRTAQDQYEYDQRQYQLGALDKSAVTRDRERVVKARAWWEAGKKPPTPEVLKRAVESRVAATKISIKALDSAAKTVAEAVNQAQHCYSSATGNGMLANPAMDDRAVAAPAPVPETPAQGAAAQGAAAQPYGSSGSTPLGGKSTGGLSHY